MRLATARVAAGTSAVRIESDGAATVLPYLDVGTLLTDPDWREHAVRARGPAIDAYDLAPLVLAPSKIWCLGMNYGSHVLETGRERPAYPSLFTKFARALIGATDPIQLPPLEVSTSVDWEVELAVVIGQRARNLTPSEALSAVAGYTISNDVSVRDWQHRSTQATAGKTFEATTPLGPHLVTGDEVDAGDLAITCTVDGYEVQAARTSEMLFSVSEILCYTSTICTLDPGDVILMGTPQGVGAARDPQVFLRPGQVLTSRIERLGELRNVCIAAG